MNNDYVGGAYQGKNRDEIADLVRKEGFDPILVQDPAGFTYPQHEHPETKLLVFLRGTMQVTVQGQSFECVAGDRLLIPGNTKHSAIVGKEGCIFFWSEKLLRP